MDLAFKNFQTRVALNPPRILRAARKVLYHEGIHEATLTFVFVSRQKIRAFNRKFLRRDCATDVLAFDLRDAALSRKKAGRAAGPLTGDIVISTDAILKNARNYRTAPSQELALYIIHGICHLIGFDDHKRADVQKMRRKEEELLAFLGKAAERLIK